MAPVSDGSPGPIFGLGARAKPAPKQLETSSEAQGKPSIARKRMPLSASLSVSSITHSENGGLDSRIDICLLKRTDPFRQARLTARTRGPADCRSQPPISREHSRTPSHDSECHRCPGEMNWPAVRHGQFDDNGHEQQPEGRKAGAEAENQQDREKDFPRSGQERHHARRRKMVGTAGKVQQELVSEEGNGRIIEPSEPIPFEDTGFPEWNRESEAHQKLNQRRAGYGLDQVVGLADKSDEPKSLIPAIMLIDDHHAAPALTAVKAPASIIPAMLVAMSKDGDASSANAAASPR